MKTFSIYALHEENEPHIFRYVGCTSNTRTRLNIHLSSARTGKKGQKNDWIRDCQIRGVEVKLVILLDNLTKEEAIQQETLHINKYWILGYLTNKEGRGGTGLETVGIKRSDVTKKKMSEAKKGRLISVEHRQNLSKALKGKKRSGEAIKNISAAQFKRPVIQLSMDGHIIHVFESLRQAHIQTGANHGNIWRCCNGQLPTTGGFAWKYASDTLLHQYGNARNLTEYRTTASHPA